MKRNRRESSPDLDPNSISKTNEFKLPAPSIITKGRLAIVGLIVLSIVVALVFVKLPEKFQYALVAAVPAILVGAYIIISPFAGVWCFVFMDYLRPYTFIVALRPLRLGILTVAVTLVSWIVFQAARKHRIYWSSQCTWFLGYLLIIATGILTAHNNFRAYQAFEGLLVTFLMFFLLLNIVDSKERLLRIIWLLLFTHVYYALKGIYNFAFVGYVAGHQVTSGVVGGSFMADENDFALALNAMIPFAFFMFQNQTSNLKRFFLIGTVLVFVLGVVSSQSRGGWVGLMAVVVFCILKSKRKLMSLSFVALLAISVAVFAPSSYWSEVQSITDTEEATANSRLNYWMAAVRMFADHPLTGVGAGNGPLRMPEYVTGFRDPATQWGRTFHGTLPLVLAETGFLGILCYLMMFAVAVRGMMVVQRKYGNDHRTDEWTLASALTGGMVGWMASATFLSAAYYPHLWTLFAMSGVLMRISKSKVEATP
ncbi:MAG: O-antigen ligase family protein [bacterium]|nr:O-antigen ligase family protein [bacterium]